MHRESSSAILETIVPELPHEFGGVSLRDAHVADPLANLMLTEESFVAMTRRLKDVAADHCTGRIVSAREGGYVNHLPSPRLPRCDELGH